MGAACGNLNCKGQKYQKQLRPTIINRPSAKDFSQDEENESVDVRIAVPPDDE